MRRGGRVGGGLFGYGGPGLVLMSEEKLFEEDDSCVYVDCGNCLKLETV
jgi:hypothetical protein